MLRFTLVIALSIAMLLLCGSPARIQAFTGDTPIVIKDGGSLVLGLDGLDAGSNWTYSRDEIRHRNAGGVLTGLQIKEAGVDRCGGDARCGVDPAKPWKIRVAYGAGWLTISSVSVEKGVHLTHRNLPFDTWKKTGNPDQREFGHGDGQRISGVKVNGGANLCAGKGCEITVYYRPK
ncbi:MAG: hypothetical protein ABSB67_14195 [Bryobacteraceae bacterium]